MREREREACRMPAPGYTHNNSHPFRVCVYEIFIIISVGQMIFFCYCCCCFYSIPSFRLLVFGVRTAVLLCSSYPHSQRFDEYLFRNTCLTKQTDICTLCHTVACLFSRPLEKRSNMVVVRLFAERYDI